MFKSVFKHGTKPTPLQKRKETNPKVLTLINRKSDNVRPGLPCIQLDTQHEEDIVYTLSYFMNEWRPRGLDISYEVKNGEINVWIDPMDLKYMVYKTVLDSSKLLEPIHIDTRLPALVKGILYGSDDIFHLCFRAFHVLMPFRVLKKRIKCPRREAIVDLKSKYTFDKLLLFLGNNLSKWKNDPESILLSVATYFQAIRFGHIQFKNENLRVMELKGSKHFATFYRNEGIAFDDEQEKFKCTPTQAENIYSRVISNNHFDAFVATRSTNRLNSPTKCGKVQKFLSGMNIKTVQYARNKLTRSYPNTLKDQRTLDEWRETKFALMVSERRNGVSLYNGKEQQKAMALLYLLDCLIFYDIVDEIKEKERQKTYMFNFMKGMIEAQKIKTMDIIVPTNDEERFGYDNLVFPIYRASKEWNVEGVNYKNNCFNLST